MFRETDVRVRQLWMMLFMMRTGNLVSTLPIVSGRMDGEERAAPTESSSRIKTQRVFYATPVLGVWSANRKLGAYS